jgi:predicted dehydrogenase
VKQNKKIGVGIIGVGGWATYGHLPAVKTVDSIEVVAVSSRTKARAKELALEHSIAHAFDDYNDLIAHPDVDLVVIPAPAPQHKELIRAVIAGGKDVYSEWPLTTNTADSEEMLALAEAKGARHVVGLQRRLSPSARYTADLIAQGFIGQIRGVTMSVGVDAFGAELPESVSWVLDPANFVHLLPVYLGHFGDLLFATVGPPATLTALTSNHIPEVTITETGEKARSGVPTEVMAIGELRDGGLYSIQLEGGQKRKTGLQIVITGSDGALRITNPRSFQNENDNTLEAMTGDATTFSALPVPGEYSYLDQGDLDASVHDVSYLYAAYANDVLQGTSTAPDFRDGVRMHHLIDQITRTAEHFRARHDATVIW